MTYLHLHRNISHDSSLSFCCVCVDQLRYLHKSAQLVVAKGGAPWLLSLRGLPRLEVRRQLLALPGVGPKVADCVALFSLDQGEAVPVDTHVRDICARDYIPPTSAAAAAASSSGVPGAPAHLLVAGARSLTPTIYEAVGDIFRERFQRKAGWYVLASYISQAIHVNAVCLNISLSAVM